MPGVDHEGRHVVEVLAVDVEDVGAMLGEQAGGRRPGQDTGEVEHPHPAQRAEPVADRHDRPVGDLLDRHAAERGDRRPLRVSGPLLAAAYHRPAGAGGGQRVLQRRRIERGHSPGDRGGVRVDVAADHLHGVRGQPGEGAVEVDPAPVGALVERDEWAALGRAWRRRAVEALQGEAHQRHLGAPGIHFDDLLLPGPIPPQQRRGDAAGAERRCCTRRDRERRRQHRRAGDDRHLDLVAWQPNLGEQIRGAAHRRHFDTVHRIGCDPRWRGVCAMERRVRSLALRVRSGHRSSGLCGRRRRSGRSCAHVGSTRGDDPARGAGRRPRDVQVGERGDRARDRRRHRHADLGDGADALVRRGRHAHRSPRRDHRLCTGP